MHPFLTASIGGALIGLSAVLLMAMTGRIAGVSGIAASLLPPRPANDWPWRAAFVGGLLLGPLVLFAATGHTGIKQPIVSLPMLAVAGLLVGIGTALGGGCTSGHGICGLARLSPRSEIAVAVFMASAFAVVFVIRHLA